jgi:hypothetical protein
VLRAAGETETTQENIQDWLQLDEASDRGRNCCCDVFIVISTIHIMKVPNYLLH